MEILSVSEMQAADALAIERGAVGADLMEAAGRAVADAIMERYEHCHVVVLAGPGNNGGDGFVVAQVLKKAGWMVNLYLLGDKADLTGDAAVHAKRWRGKVHPLENALDALAGMDGSECVLVVDALFGTGLTRPLQGTSKMLAELVTVSQAQGAAPLVVSIDIPSGLNGDTGRALGGRRRGGICFHADLTVTFCRPKPGHALMPGRGVCGDIVIADIGISDDVVDEVKGHKYLNTPSQWGEYFPFHEEDVHKYARGHVTVLGGPVMCGAARMVSYAARRIGAGLACIAAPTKAFNIYAIATEPGTLVAPIKDAKAFRKLISDSRKNACVIGPGAGIGKATRDMTLDAIKLGKSCVIDADAITCFQKAPKALFQAIKAARKANMQQETVVLTPHSGEFARIFPDLAARLMKPKNHDKDCKVEVTRDAAKRAGCIVLLKGPDTVVASPDGCTTISVNAPASLATAGAGDVLSGMISGLMAQGMPAFAAANAAVWLHGEAANTFGPGLVAEDLCEELPYQLGELMEELIESGSVHL
ncbi:MAG: NAD(P)H-hydrate dehydratase [Magnetovibrio sp.]|nr:NAD(P)H-hydrate dehydratase [Magnetovibrio sp.]